MRLRRRPLRFFSLRVSFVGRGFSLLSHFFFENLSGRRARKNRGQTERAAMIDGASAQRCSRPRGDVDFYPQNAQRDALLFIFPRTGAR